MNQYWYGKFGPKFSNFTFLWLFFVVGDGDLHDVVGLVILIIFRLQYFDAMLTECKCFGSFFFIAKQEQYRMNEEKKKL